MGTFKPENTMRQFQKIDAARKLLKLPEYATLDDIKTAYRKLAHQYHPDQCEGDKYQCEMKFRKVTEAKNELIDYCVNYAFSFKEADMAKNKNQDPDVYADFIKRFYQDFMI